MRTKRLKPFTFNTISAGLGIVQPAEGALLAFAEGLGIAAADAVLFEVPFLPASPAVPNDGRLPLEYDQASLIHNYNARAAAGRMVPIDTGHRILFDAATPAVGWVAHLAQASWDPAQTSAWCLGTEAQALITSKQMGYTSPVVYGYDSTDRGATVVTGVHSHTLTNTPALEMPMNFAEGGEGAELEPEAPSDEQSEATTEAPAAAVEPTEAAASTEALAPVVETPAAPATDLTALSATAPAADVIALTSQLTSLTASLTSLTAERDTANEQVTALSAQLATFQSQVTALTAERDTATTALATFQAADHDRQVTEAVSGLISAGKATPAQHDSLTTFARKDLAAFREFAAASTVLPAFSRIAIPGHEAADETFGLSAEHLNLCKTNGIKPELFAKNLSQK